MFWSVVALCSLSTAHPILELLGSRPEFFIAHGLGGAQVVAICLALGLLIPVGLGLLLAALLVVSARAGRVFHMILVFMLAALLVIESLEVLGIDSVLVAIPLGVSGGIGANLLFYMSRTVRWLARLSFLVPIAVVVNFVAISPASALLSNTETVTGPEGVTVGEPSHIVMIVFDELPVASLMDSNGRIQESNYPNFARLAKDSYWFSNAVTVESNTERAIPSILTGNRAKSGAIPTAVDYPDNLFTLLGGIYDIRAYEPLTDLCPRSSCSDESPLVESLVDWETLTSDIGVVGLHVLLPSALTRDLPRIDEAWRDFGNYANPDSGSLGSEQFDLRREFESEIEAGQLSRFERFLQAVDHAEAGPVLFFGHFLLPHAPWKYLPDGRQHGAPQPPFGKVNRGWGADEWLVNQAYQRHLLQVQFTDRLLGRLIEQLESSGIYEDTLIVVVADHGISMRPNVERRRALTSDTIGEIVTVPLFIKPPGDTFSGVIDEYRAELIDVLPTVADILELEIPWPTEGISLIKADRPRRSESKINSGAASFLANATDRLEIARRKIGIFGDGSLFGLSPTGTSHLLGTRIDVRQTEDQSDLTAILPRLAAYRAVDLSADVLPVYVTGSLTGASESVLIAAAVNARVVAITQSFEDDGLVRFQALLPPDSLRNGRNSIDLFEVVERHDELLIKPIHITTPMSGG